MQLRWLQQGRNDDTRGGVAFQQCLNFPPPLRTCLLQLDANDVDQRVSVRASQATLCCLLSACSDSCYRPSRPSVGCTICSTAPPRLCRGCAFTATGTPVCSSERPLTGNFYGDSQRRLLAD